MPSLMGKKPRKRRLPAPNLQDAKLLLRVPQPLRVTLEAAAIAEGRQLSGQARKVLTDWAMQWLATHEAMK